MTIKHPRFSIIIPTRDRANLLKDCLKSVFDQSYQDFECIVVDDGSTDHTKEAISHFPDERLRYYFHPTDDRSESRNYGIERASGDFICFLDDDDWIKIDYLSSFNDLITNGTYQGQVIRTSFVKFINGQEYKTPHYSQLKYNHPLKFIAFNMCGVGSLCIPIEYLKEYKFPTAFPHWQDTYLFLNLLARYPMVQMNNYNYVYRIHDDMGSKLVIDEEQLKRRSELNTRAIKDFSENHFDEVSQYLSYRDFSYLLAEKYIQYALHAKEHGFSRLAKELKKKSLSAGYYWRLWKYYLRGIKI